MLTSNIYGIAFGFVFFQILFQVTLRTSLFFPPPAQLSYKDKVEWSSRVVSSAHAAVMTLGALFVYFGEAQSYSPSSCIFGYSTVPASFASVFLGYIFYDTTFCTYYFHLFRDYASLTHHLLFSLVCGYALEHSLMKFQFCWLMLTEASTPPLNLRWHLAVLQQKERPIYMWNGALCFLLFFVFRVVGYGLGIWHLFELRELWMAPGVPQLLSAVVALICLSYFLNLYWFGLLTQGIVRLFFRPKTTKTA